MKPRYFAVGAVGALLAASLTPLLTAGSAAAVDDINTAPLQRAVTVKGVMEHARAFQQIADDNGGTRASGTSGYDASAAYVAAKLRKAGYRVTVQEFTFPFYRELAPSQVSQVSPTPTNYVSSTLDYSGSGNVTGTVVPTNDVVIPPGPTPSSSNSGCEATDFVPASATEDQVALVQRGTCTFEIKANNALAAGYDAVVVFNEGQPGRDGLLAGTLSNPSSIPVVGLSFADGAALYAAAAVGPVSVNVVTSTEADLNAVTTNVFADSRKGDPNKTIVVGAHLDSVQEGPGINDNGSGSATILEIAEQMVIKGVQPRQRVRFAFWGAEESGLLGSEHYVANLSAEALGQIVANLNFDMVGSPNYVRFVYDGDGSDTAVVGPPGSAEIEQLFVDHYAAAGLASSPTEFSGRSDYGPFIAVGIPAGGLFSGAEGIKTAAEAATYGGTAGVAYDACYHQVCDTIDNVNTSSISEMGDAAAHAVMTLARSKTGFFGDGGFRTAPQAARSAASEGVKDHAHWHKAVR